MKGKIDILFTVSNYGADPRVTTRALLRRKGANSRRDSISGVLLVSPHHEIKKYETLQLIAAKHKMLDELDNAISNSKGAFKLVIPGLPAEFIHAKRKSDGTEYDAILVNFGTEDAKHLRVFYLSDMHSEILASGFKPEYKFDVQEEPEIEEDEDPDSEETEE